MSALPDTVTVLVVQPDEQTHLPVQQALKAIERPRYEIHWVTTPAAALAALEEHHHDAVRAIKCNSGLRRVPVVVIARRPEPDQVEAAYDAGANTVIPKPVTFLALVKLMKVFTAYWLEAAALPHPAE